MKPDLHEHAKTYSRIVAKAWDDEAFKKRLLASPADVLREHGIEVPARTSVRVTEDVRSPEFRDGLILLPLPPKPTSAELSDEELEGVAGGGGWCWGSGDLSPAPSSPSPIPLPYPSKSGPGESTTKRR
jgi:hypothetical protein